MKEKQVNVDRGVKMDPNGMFYRWIQWHVQDAWFDWGHDLWGTWDLNKVTRKLVDSRKNSFNPLWFE